MVAFTSVNSFAEIEKTRLSLPNDVFITIETPKSIVRGEIFPISFLVDNYSDYTARINMTIIVDYPAYALKPVSDNIVKIDYLSGSGTIGKTLYFEVLPDATSGNEFLNIHYRGLKSLDKAIPIQIKSGPAVLIKTKTAESIFTDAEFKFEVIIEPQGIDIRDVTVQFIPPTDINFRGETLHSFSIIENGHSISMSSQLITKGQEEVSTQHYLPFQIKVEYTDDENNKNIETKTVSILLRPRTVFEFGSDGGFWIGDFFIAPYISIGTLVGAPLGIILAWIIKRIRKK